MKRKTQKTTETGGAAEQLPPRAFVFTKGKVPATIKALVEDLKRVMSPNTAQDLKAQKRNKLRDFVDVAGALHVSFFLILSATDKHCYLRVVRTPRGPTLTFRVDAYSLSSDVSASVRKPYSPSDAVWQTAPMLVISNFDKTKQHEALSATMLQNLFPTLNVATARLATFRRVVLVHQLPEEEGGHAELRQYVIKAAPTGVSRGVKKLVRATNKLPSLGRYGDVADYLTGGGGMSSDTGGETDDEDKAELPQDYVGRNTKKNQKVSIKLHEVGPRLSLTLLKVEEGLCDGATLYHKLVSKTKGEEEETAAKIEARAALKAERKALQQANVDRKKAAAEEKSKSKRGRRKLGEEGGGAASGDDASSAGGGDIEDGAFEDEDYEEEEGGGDEYDDDAAYGAGAELDAFGRSGERADEKYNDDDAAWYREQVGEEPDGELGLKKRKGGGLTARVAAAAGPSGGKVGKRSGYGKTRSLQDYPSSSASSSAKADGARKRGRSSGDGPSGGKSAGGKSAGGKKARRK